MNLETLGRVLILGAVGLLVAGGLLLLLAKLGVPRLPGDITVEGKNWKLFFPIATSIVLSIVLTVLLNLLGRFWR